MNTLERDILQTLASAPQDVQRLGECGATLAILAKDGRISLKRGIGRTQAQITPEGLKVLGQNVRSGHILTP